MNDTTPRLIKVGYAISQLFNVLLLPRHKYTNANESVSGRCHRCGWKCAEKVINTREQIDAAQDLQTLDAVRWDAPTPETAPEKTDPQPA